MFEGPIRAADHAGSEELPILNQLRWTDLVARLAATRQTRPTGLQNAEDQLASFASFHRDGARDGQHSINRDALAHGKLSRINPPDAANNAGDGDRETE